MYGCKTYRQINTLASTKSPSRLDAVASLKLDAYDSPFIWFEEGLKFGRSLPEEAIAVKHASHPMRLWIFVGGYSDVIDKIQNCDNHC